MEVVNFFAILKYRFTFRSIIIVIEIEWFANDILINALLDFATKVERYQRNHVKIPSPKLAYNLPGNVDDVVLLHSRKIRLHTFPLVVRDALWARLPFRRVPW